MLWFLQGGETFARRIVDVKGKRDDVYDTGGARTYPIIFECNSRKINSALPRRRCHSEKVLQGLRDMFKFYKSYHKFTFSA